MAAQLRQSEMMERNSSRRKLSKAQKLGLHARMQARRDLYQEYVEPREDRNISEAKDYLDEIIKGLGLVNGVEKEEMQASWTETAGEFLAKHTQPVALKRGILTVKVLQPSMRFHLEEAKPKMLRNLQNKHGNETIKNIQFSIG